MMDTRIDIYTGLLGCGKTSLIKRLLQTDYVDKKVAIIENEIGKINLDAEALDSPGISVTPITNGCVCCTIQGDFVKAIDLLIEKERPDYIIIEPSGVANINGLINAVSKVKSAVLRRQVLLLNARKFLALISVVGDFFKEQLASAPCIYLNFTEQMSPEEINHVITSIRSVNNKAQVINTPLADITSDIFACAGSIVNPVTPSGKSRIKILSLNDNHIPKMNAVISNQSVLYTSTLDLPQPLSANQFVTLKRILAEADCSEVWRAKGIFRLMDETIERIDLTFGDVYEEDTEIKSENLEGKLVLIGPKINNLISRLKDFCFVFHSDVVN